MSNKAAYSIAEFCKSYSIGKTTVYEEINAGRLRAVKIGKRTLISAEAAVAWFDSLEQRNERTRIERMTLALMDTERLPKS